MVENVRSTSDELAFKIEHKPRLTVPDEILEYIKLNKHYIEE
jgi:hypothetical protein